MLIFFEVILPGFFCRGRGPLLTDRLKAARREAVLSNNRLKQAGFAGKTVQLLKWM
ncbi:hypothetical protein [Desulfobulbus propionicus]